MKKYYVLIVLIVSAAFFSCNESKYKAEIKTIDSLNVVLDSIQNKLGEIDTVKIRSDYKEYIANVSLLKKNFNDKKEDSTWLLMTSYGAVKSALKSFIRDYPGFYSEIKFSRNQLDSLKADIKSGDLQPEKVKEYTKTECEAVSNLKTLVTASVEGAQSRITLLDSLNPKVIKLIGNLKEEKNAGEKESSEEEDD